jgi:hypothetical protein
MNKQDMAEKLNQKLERNYKDFVNGWLEMEPSAIIANAQEIAAAKQAYDGLKANAPNIECLEYLLRFENPLEAVTDRWFCEQYLPDMSKELEHALWSLMDDQEAEAIYELDSEYNQEQTGGVKLC